MTVRVGLVGYGYWGPNIGRNFAEIEGAKVVAICDLDDNRRRRAATRHPDASVVADYAAVTDSQGCDAVAVVTPVSMHYEVAKSALTNGKHVFVEKPFTASADQAKELIELAEKSGLVIMVDHTFLFTGAVRKIKEIIGRGDLGDVLYFDSTRINLGLFQNDVNVMWDLAPHDLSIMDYVVGKRVNAIAAHGMDHYGKGLANTAFLTLFCEDNCIAHFNVNWLSPVKVRRTLIGGTQRMLVWDDMEADEKIKVYDKGVSIDTRESRHKLLVTYRAGDAAIPRIETNEALRLETEYFVECVKQGLTPINDGRAGLQVVRYLEAAEESLGDSGRLVQL